jgi:cyclophilin family peptidyl-prolyl cis-trans isomerase
LSKFFYSLLFHRIGNQFMTQGGDHTSKNATDVVPPGGGSSPGDRIPTDLNLTYF